MPHPTQRSLLRYGLSLLVEAGELPREVLQDPESVAAQMRRAIAVASGDRLNPNRVVGRLLRETRQARHLTQAELVRSANGWLGQIGGDVTKFADSSAISRIERGHQELNYLQALALARALRVPIDAFSPWAIAAPVPPAAAPCSANQLPPNDDPEHGD